MEAEQRDDTHAADRPRGARLGKATGFLDLPAELRLQRYDYIFTDGSHGIGMSTKPRVQGCREHLFYSSFGDQRAGHGAIMLRTCRQIHREANAMLYSTTNFCAIDAEAMTRFVEQIGPTNLACIESMTLFVTCMAKAGPWIQLLQALADGATGLLTLTIEWDAKMNKKIDVVWPPRPGSMGRGLGDKVNFVRALAQIQGLQLLTIKGYYAKHWPEYLKRMMDVGVCQPTRRKKGGEARDKRERKRLLQYQTRTDKFIP